MKSAAPFALAATIIATPAVAQEMRPALTAASAQAIVEGCRAYAENKGWRLNIALLDQGPPGVPAHGRRSSRFH